MRAIFLLWLSSALALNHTSSGNNGRSPSVRSDDNNSQNEDNSLDDLINVIEEALDGKTLIEHLTGSRACEGTYVCIGLNKCRRNLVILNRIGLIEVKARFLITLQRNLESCGEGMVCCGVEPDQIDTDVLSSLNLMKLGSQQSERKSPTTRGGNKRPSSGAYSPSRGRPSGGGKVILPNTGSSPGVKKTLSSNGAGQLSSNGGIYNVSTN